MATVELFYFFDAYSNKKICLFSAIKYYKIVKCSFISRALTLLNFKTEMSKKLYLFIVFWSCL